MPDPTGQRPQILTPSGDINKVTGEPHGGQSTPRVVFIDNMGPLHPDYLVHKTDSSISIETHSNIICRVLDETEKRFGTEVVIAVHPRATPGVMEP